MGFNLMARDQSSAASEPVMTQADLQSAIALANINPQSIIFGGINSLLGVSSPGTSSGAVASSLFPAVPTINSAEQALAAGLKVSQSILSSPLSNPLGFGLAPTTVPPTSSLFSQQPVVIQPQSVVPQPFIQQPVVQNNSPVVTTVQPQTLAQQVPLSMQQQLFQLPGVTNSIPTNPILGTTGTGTGPVINIVLSPEQAQGLTPQASLLALLANTLASLKTPFVTTPVVKTATPVVKTATPVVKTTTPVVKTTTPTTAPAAAKAPTPPPPQPPAAKAPPPPPPPPPAPAPPPFVIPPVQATPTSPSTTEHTITTDAEADAEMAAGKDVLDRIDGNVDGKYSDQDLIKVLEDTNGVYDGNLRSAVRYTLQKHLDAAKQAPAQPAPASTPPKPAPAAPAAPAPPAPAADADLVIPPVQANPFNVYSKEHTITTDAEADAEIDRAKGTLDMLDGVQDGKYSDKDLVKVLQDSAGVYDGNLKSAVRYILMKKGAKVQ
jgi:hypothetical protein